MSLLTAFGAVCWAGLALITVGSEDLNFIRLIAFYTFVCGGEEVVAVATLTDTV